METLTLRLESIAPLLMHNGQLANPKNHWAKELAKVNKGKAKDLEAASKIEFFGGLYLDADEQPCVPGDMVYAMVVAGAKARKRGKDAKAGVFEGAPTFKLEYDGPQTPDELWTDGRFTDVRNVAIAQATIMRTRPIFRQWACQISLICNEDLMTADDVRIAVERAGLAIGLGDYRPRFGRFEVSDAR